MIKSNLDKTIKEDPKIVEYRIPELEKMLIDKKYEYVYMPARNKYQIDLGDIIVDVYADDGEIYARTTEATSIMEYGDFVFDLIQAGLIEKV